MKRKVWSVLFLTVVALISVFSLTAGTAFASEWGDIDFDDVPVGPLTVSPDWAISVAWDQTAIADQGTVTATPVATSSPTHGLGLVADAGPLQPYVLEEGQGQVTNGAIRVTFNTPKYYVHISAGTTDVPGATVHIDAYDGTGTLQNSATIDNVDASPRDASLTTRRNDISYVVIWSNEAFWIDDLSYDYMGIEDPFAILDKDSYTGTTGVPVTFDASASYNRDNNEMTYLWSFDDGATWTEPSYDPVYVYTWDNAWQGTVTLKVRSMEDKDKYTEDVTTAPVTITVSDYANHGAYVSSIAKSTEPGKGKGQIVSEAARSDIGKKVK